MYNKSHMQELYDDAYRKSWKESNMYMRDHGARSSKTKSMSDVSRAFQWNLANQVRRTEQYRENARRETKVKGIRRKNAAHKYVSI